MASAATSFETPIGSSVVISGKAVDVVVPLKQDEQVREAEEIGEQDAQRQQKRRAGEGTQVTKLRRRTPEGID